MMRQTRSNQLILLRLLYPSSQHQIFVVLHSEQKLWHLVSLSSIDATLVCNSKNVFRVIGGGILIKPQNMFRVLGGGIFIKPQNVFRVISGGIFIKPRNVFRVIGGGIFIKPRNVFHVIGGRVLGGSLFKPRNQATKCLIVS